MISYENYKEKVQGCFLGKNIGGTLGAPFECRRGLFDIDFYTQELNGKPLPNDDLDLQLVWLNAAEKYGRGVDAALLGEYWLMFITPNWSEYGAAKNNLRMGLTPPFSGYVNNLNRDSNGAYIRTEIWACLAPGHPEIAVQYAYEDASVDHSGEGVWATLFCAAMESAAFVESDLKKLVQIGLSYIPKDCAVAGAVKLVFDLQEQGIDWKTARKRILQAYPSYFGTMWQYDPNAEPDIPVGRIGYDAPANIGLTMLGLVYGEEDFGKSICLAASCGEDADCTAATIGALFGIRYGINNIPEKWKQPIGQSIQTISVNRGDYGCPIPNTIEELTGRILKLVPVFLHEYVDIRGCNFTIEESNQLSHSGEIKNQLFTLRRKFPLVDISVDIGCAPVAESGKTFKIKIHIDNNYNFQQWFRLDWLADEEIKVSPQRKMSYYLEQNHGNVGKLDIEYEMIVPENLTKDKYEVVLGFYFNGRHTKYFVPLTFVNTVKSSYDV